MSDLEALPSIGELNLGHDHRVVEAAHVVRASYSLFGLSSSPWTDQPATLPVARRCHSATRRANVNRSRTVLPAHFCMDLMNRRRGHFPCWLYEESLMVLGPAAPNWTQHRIPGTNQHPISMVTKQMIVHGA